MRKGEGCSDMIRSARLIKSKLLKTTVLLKDSTLKWYVPETHAYSASSLQAMLTRYGMVYVKPDAGRYGRGVMKVEDARSAHDAFHLYFGPLAKEHTSYERLLTAVEREIASRDYIVQQGIHVITYKGRIFDIRIMVQQSPVGRWDTTGFLARVAAPNRVVTNFHGGGTPQELKPILVGYMTSDEADAYINSLSRLGERVALCFQNAFPAIRAVGLDIAIDQDMRPWILEVNTRPLGDVFAKLPDKTMYRTMWQYEQYSRRALNWSRTNSRKRAGRRAFY